MRPPPSPVIDEVTVMRNDAEVASAPVGPAAAYRRIVALRFRRLCRRVLVFWIQPLAVRGVLPVLGGSPAVWNTAMVFFQSALLAGYALAHLLVRRAPPVAQLVVLASLWAFVGLASPIGGLRLLGDAPAGLPPALWLLGTLAGALGLAFVAASSLTPLVQAWLARAGAGTVSADPYFLYSASNAGSAGALLAYPFLLEAFFGLDVQARLWSVACSTRAPAFRSVAGVDPGAGRRTCRERFRLASPTRAAGRSPARAVSGAERAPAREHPLPHH